ncbi:MAG: hypothetical protein EBV86_12660 [Marivivens sp.]|nr:hypothetical protein [Marivivens sp.]
MINAFLWAASWFIPSDEQQPMGPVMVYCHNLPEEVFAILRASWDNKVEEVTVYESETAYDDFNEMLMFALEEGAEVDIQTQYHPTDIGIHIEQ